MIACKNDYKATSNECDKQGLSSVEYQTRTRVKVVSAVWNAKRRRRVLTRDKVPQLRSSLFSLSLTLPPLSSVFVLSRIYHCSLSFSLSPHFWHILPSMQVQHHDPVSRHSAYPTIQPRNAITQLSTNQHMDPPPIDVSRVSLPFC